MTTNSADLSSREPLAPTPSTPKRRWIIGLSILAVLLAATLWAFLHVGTWLIVEDPIEPADVIVVLSGRMPERAIEAARLFAQKAAPEVWITQPVSPAEELAAMQIPYVGEDFYSQRVLLARNVPALSIRILPDPIINTQQEVEEIGRMARENKFQRVVIVTSAPHTRRVRAIWERLIGATPRLIVRHPPDDPFNGPRWWRNTRDALDVVRETFGLVNVWAGFFSQPGRD
jgi:uncharacterized SAM-binding protein YcdF (DUF218 family)